METYFIVSDLHMGDGSSADDFKPNKKLFLDFLEHVKRQEGTLILAGDVFELWQADLQSILKNNFEVFKMLFELRPKVIVGNHDYYLKTFIDFDFVYYPALQIEAESGDIIRVEHGNVYDPNNDPEKNMQLGKIVAAAGGIAENWVHPDIDETFMSFVGKAKSVGNSVCEEITTPWTEEKRTKKKQSNNNYVKAANNIVKENDDISWVVFGHTHNAEIKHEQHYVNSGCWVKEIPSFVKIDKNNIGLYEFRDNKEKERDSAKI
ncbi:MAG: metallophosphoesterase [Bacteroidota bacterium]